MPGDRLLIAAQSRKSPCPSCVGVRHRFQCREGFRRNDTEGFGRIEVTDSFREVGSIDIGYEPECHSAVAVMFESFVGHHWPEVRAANADIHDVTDALARVTFPGTAADALGEVSHLVENGVNLGHYIVAINDDGRTFGSTQSDMQHGSLFSDVDLFTPEHRLNSRLQICLFGQFKEELDSLV